MMLRPGIEVESAMGGTCDVCESSGVSVLMYFWRRPGWFRRSYRVILCLRCIVSLMDKLSKVADYELRKLRK